MAKFDLLGSGAGALTGSAFGPAGAAVGGLLGLFGKRKKKKPKRLSTLDPTQQGLYQKYAQGLQGGGEFANLFNFNHDQARDVFNQNYAQPAYQNFKENIVPSITGQFRGGNLQNSSYLGQALSKAGTDVQKNLDAQLSKMLYEGQQSSIDRHLGSLNNILGMQTFAYQRPQASAFDNAIGGFAPGAAQSAGEKFMDFFKPRGSNIPSTS